MQSLLKSKSAKKGTGIRNYVSADSKIEALSKSLAIIEFTPEGEILDCNENFLKAVGYSRSEVVGKHHRIFMDPKQANSRSYEEFWAHLRSGKFHSGEFERVIKDGTHMWLEATYNPVFDDAGRLQRVVKFGSDITEKKNEMNRLKTMVDGMPVAVMTVDMKNDFKIDYVNETSIDLLKGLEKHIPIKTNQMVGTSIDVFHKNPQHQRRLLADDRNLPYTTKIKLGDEVLELKISAIRDVFDKYVGPMLTWSVITSREMLATEVSETVNIVNRVSENVRQSADGLNRSAEAASDRAASVSAAAEQMSASIQEIASQVTGVSDRSANIAQQAGNTDQRVKELADNAGKVEAVVTLIQSIAEQTNLLALNATIEAARAGDAGRGFAVVANEVKALAMQTSKATEEIGQQVAAIRGSSGEAVSAMEAIALAVDELSQLTTKIAGAVEEQSSTTREMTQNITGVSDAATSTGSLAGSLQETALELSRNAGNMKNSIDRFLANG